jgi:hypothetical protein
MQADKTPVWLREFVRKNYPYTFNPVEEDGFDGLMDSWPTGEGNLSFVNCPFSEAQLWIEKAVKELKRGAESVLWVPATFNSVYFREAVYPNASEIQILTCPLKQPGKTKQIVAQTCLLIFVVAPPLADDELKDPYPLVTFVDPPGWQEAYYVRPRNRSRFGGKKLQ